MAIQSQSVLCRRLGETYLQAVLQGRDFVPVQISWLADILDYLNPEDTKTDRIHKMFLDDAETDVIEKFIEMKEKKNDSTIPRPE